MENPETEFTFDHIIDPLAPLDFDPLVNFGPAVPSINVDQANSNYAQSLQTWEHSPPHQPVDLRPHQVHQSPAFSSHSQDSSSTGFLSPRQTDPMTPSPTSNNASIYTDTYTTPESVLGRLDSLSPSTGPLGLSVRTTLLLRI